MPGAVESLLSLAGLGLGDSTPSTTSTTPLRTTTLLRSSSREIETSSTVVKVTSTTSLKAVVSTTTAVRMTVTPTTSTRSSTTSTSKLETRISTTSSSIKLPSTTSLISSTTSPTSSTFSSISLPSSSSAKSSSSVFIPNASSTVTSTASARKQEGIKMSGGIIAAIVIPLILVLLALFLVGFRYYKRKQRRDLRRVSGLSVWAGAGAVGGWQGSQGRGSQQEGWEREKEIVTPFPVNDQYQNREKPLPPITPERSDFHPTGYPPQGTRPYDAYNNPIPNPSFPTAPPPVSIFNTHPQSGNGGYTPYEAQYWIPGTPNTFGSFGSQGAGTSPPSSHAHGALLNGMGVDHGQGGSEMLIPVASANGNGNGNGQLQEQVQGDLARDRGMLDGSKVVVKQGFVRSLDDELVIAPGDNLTLVQAYDDGWCLCERVVPNGPSESGVVPLTCLEPFAGAARAEESVNMPEPVVIGHAGIPESSGKGLNVPGAPQMTRSSTSRSLATSERSERRSSLFINAATAGLWLQTQPTGLSRDVQRFS